MTKHLRLLAVLLMLSVLAGFSVVRFAHLLPQPVAESFGLRGDIAEIRERITPQLQTELAEMGLSLGSPIYVRIFKETSELEVWIQDGAQFSHFKTYPICNYSGDLGPKLQEGDRQSPEGFYRVTEASLNPRSRFHLSFNLGFPNQYDRFHGYSGSFLMVHGSCLSVGCYAMTDPAIEEIYVLIETALRAGQNFVPVHAFPFEMSEERMERAASSEWQNFWSELAPGFKLFEATRLPPKVSVVDGHYNIQPGKL